MKNLFFILLFYIAISNFLLGNSLSGIRIGSSNAIGQYGISWTFDKKLTRDGSGDSYHYGQYCNGDYWIVGPVKIIDIYPGVKTEGLTANGNPRVMNGSIINPSVAPQSGFDNGHDNYINYISSLNVGIGVSSSSPLNLEVNSSLLTSIGSDEIVGVKSAIDTVAVLTCVSVVPLENSFRPPYIGTDKTSYFNESNIQYIKLKNLSTIPTSVPSWSTVSRYVERPYMEFYANWANVHDHPKMNMRVYGRDMAAEISICSLMINLDYSNEEKRKTVIGLIQIGIDFYSIYDPDNFFWFANGGIFLGRKWPILFAGVMLNNYKMANIGFDTEYILGEMNAVFHEDGQTFYVAQSDVDVTHSPEWTPDSPGYPYEVSDIGMPEWGIRRNYKDYLSNKWWGTKYRQCCNAIAWKGYALATIIMDFKDLWNHDPFFDYTDRFMAIANGDPDPFGFAPVPGAEAGWRSQDDFSEDMWDIYRNQY